jgi:hypothetical protein
MNSFPAHKWLKKKAKKGVVGYPIGTIAFYGPDDSTASKVAVGIVIHDNDEVVNMKKWCSDSHDLRHDNTVLEEIKVFLKENQVVSVSMADRILGCPHEEGIDYPNGQKCPSCPFWKDRDRFTGEVIQ